MPAGLQSTIELEVEEMTVAALVPNFTIKELKVVEKCPPVMVTWQSPVGYPEEGVIAVKIGRIT